VAVNVSS
ncbi:hypothetical protein D018_3865B, partial [Vibrio parahaemolyticus VP2007-007]